MVVGKWMVSNGAPNTLYGPLTIPFRVLRHVQTNGPLWGADIFQGLYAIPISTFSSCQNVKEEKEEGNVPGTNRLGFLFL